MLQLVINFVFFQGTWLALVAGAANGLLWPGAILAALFVAWEIRSSRNRRGLLALIGCGILGGILIDGGFAQTGLIEYELPAGPFAPWWILGLWVIFSLTLTQSMGWIRQRPVVGSLLAGIAAPLSYIAGNKLGAIHLPHGTLATFAVTAITWMPAIYAMVWLSQQLIPKTNQELDAMAAAV